ncbi:MAG: transposase [Microvirga sp.]
MRNRRAGHGIRSLDVFLPETDIALRLVAKRIKDGEWLIVLTNTADPKRALRAYKRRWAVECLFADIKTRGLNLEDTHLTIPAKIETLVALLARHDMDLSLRDTDHGHESHSQKNPWQAPKVMVPYRL